MSERNVNRCAREIRGALREDFVDDLARRTGFCRKRRKFTAVRAAWTFITGLASGKINTLADLLRLFTDLTDETMGYKPFHDRLVARGSRPPGQHTSPQSLPTPAGLPAV